MIIVRASVWQWNAAKGGWHFLTVTGNAAAEIRFDSLGQRGGFGSVKVTARIGEIAWRTSLFPSGDDWILPLKAEVRRRAEISAGDEIEVSLDLA